MRADVNDAHWTERLSEYLDGDLTAAEQRAADHHLATCAPCAATLAELRAVVAEARALEPPLPELDLWPAIARRLEPRRGWRERLATLLSGRRFTLTLPQLATAAAALVAVTGLATWLAVQRPGAQAPATGPVASRTLAGRTTPAPVPAPETGPERRVSEFVETSPATDPGAVRLASFDASRYDAAVAELERVLSEQRGQLDTATVRILEQNLAIIDRAVEDARRALEADPANPYLNGHLAQQMMAKIRLLQRAAGVVAAHG
jgi:hypothetical protein